MPDPKRRTLPPVPAALLAIVSVQGGATIAKRLFPVLGAAGTAGIRIGLSAVMLMLVFRPSVQALRAGRWRLVVPYGLVLAAMNLLFYLAIERIPLGLAVTLEFLGPLVLAVAGSRGALDFVWVALAASGIALIAPWNRGGVDLIGALLATLAGAGWAAYIVLGGRVSRVLPGGPAVALGLSVATIAILPFTLAGGGLTHLTPSLLAAGAVLALLSSALPFTLEMHALGAMPARTFGVLMSLEPAIAAICGLLLLRERLTGAQWVSVALVIAASAGATATARKVPVHVEC
ncbi:MAG TPA: EamA family transporter [Myxococcales bacterium]|jgi:inner membrane transporter RhtA|nr:EamA family transporter [Myxococcales bacterium]